jgi:hypothetical protein
MIIRNYEKFIGPLTLSKDALREEGYLWLLKCSGHISIDDVEYFNTPSYV